MEDESPTGNLSFLVASDLHDEKNQGDQGVKGVPEERIEEIGLAPGEESEGQSKPFSKQGGEKQSDG